MLGKLMKHDFKAIGKLLLPLNALVLLMSFVGVILRQSGMFDQHRFVQLLAILVITYTIVVIVIIVITYFYPVIYFYRNLFTRQGYLTFTLPVSSWKILASKTIVGYGWYLINIVVLIFSIWALAGFPTMPAEAYAEVNYYIMREIGWSLGGFIGWAVGVTLVGVLFTLVMAYLSISIGQLFGKFKIGASIVAYIVIGTIIQILTTVAMVIFLMSTPVPELMYEPMPGEFLTFILYMTLVFYGVLGGLFYVLSGVILRKKVNLD
jgi:hypothetical protein